jgi:hypothetical protein
MNLDLVGREQNELLLKQKTGIPLKKEGNWRARHLAQLIYSLRDVVGGGRVNRRRDDD